MFQFQKLALIYPTTEELFDGIIHAHDQTRRFLQDRGSWRIFWSGSCHGLKVRGLFYGTLSRDIVVADIVELTNDTGRPATIINPRPATIINPRPATKDDLIYMAAEVFSKVPDELINIFMAHFMSRKSNELQVPKNIILFRIPGNHRYLTLDRGINHMIRDEFIHQPGQNIIVYPDMLSSGVVFDGLSKFMRGSSMIDDQPTAAEYCEIAEVASKILK